MRPPVSKTCQFFADCQNLANLQRNRSFASEAPKFCQTVIFFKTCLGKVSPVWRRALATMISHPVHLTLFTVISMETRNVSGFFFQILMTCFFNLVTGNNLKRWLQQDNLLRSQVVQATTQTSASRAKTARPIKGRKSRVAGERRVKNMQRREKSAKS